MTTTIDESRAVSAVIGPDGGSFSATGADGSRFTLEIPGGAIVQEIEVTMTPIDSMDGLPVGLELAAAVRFEPEGMTFYDFVTLIIEPAEAIRPDQQLPIGSSSGTGALTIPVIDSDQDTIRLQLLHFSTAGLSKGFSASLEPVRQRLGGDVEARIQSLVAAELARARQSGGAPDTGTMEDLLDLYREQVIKPRLAAAGESCAAGRLAIQTVLSFERQRQLVGTSSDGGELAEVANIMPMVSRICLQEEYELCRDEHIVDRMVPSILSVERTSQLLGTGNEEMEKVLAEAWDLARKCLTFELTFESVLEERGPDFEATSHVRAIVTVEYVVGSGFQGSGPIEYLEFSATGTSTGGCTGEYVGEGSTFTVRPSPLQSPWEIHPAPVESISMVIDPGTPTEFTTMTCPSMDPISVQLDTWSTFFTHLHETEKLDQGYLIFGWEPVGPSVYARKTYEQVVSTDEEDIEERTTLDLVHTPQ